MVHKPHNGDAHPNKILNLNSAANEFVQESKHQLSVLN